MEGGPGATAQGELNTHSPCTTGSDEQGFESGACAETAWNLLEERVISYVIDENVELRNRIRRVRVRQRDVDADEGLALKFRPMSFPPREDLPIVICFVALVFQTVASSSARCSLEFCLEIVETEEIDGSGRWREGNLHWVVHMNEGGPMWRTIQREGRNTTTGKGGMQYRKSDRAGEGRAYCELRSGCQHRGRALHSAEHEHGEAPAVSSQQTWQERRASRPSASPVNGRPHNGRPHRRSNPGFAFSTTSSSFARDSVTVPAPARARSSAARRCRECAVAQCATLGVQVEPPCRQAGGLGWRRLKSKQTGWREMARRLMSDTEYSKEGLEEEEGTEGDGAGAKYALSPSAWVAGASVPPTTSAGTKKPENTVTL
ncbi:hypothetical protein FB451DRAFT_1363922 [Mycena latifolia]|nr:hypothetical protein FB451DRAFT_1363922 [Mycena latifolia]